jgi:hypothetical protein
MASQHIASIFTVEEIGSAKTACRLLACWFLLNLFL